MLGCAISMLFNALITQNLVARSPKPSRPAPLPPKLAASPVLYDNQTSVMPAPKSKIAPPQRRSQSIRVRGRQDPVVVPLPTADQTGTIDVIVTRSADGSTVATDAVPHVHDSATKLPSSRLQQRG
jgi:hypothetical protein